ncbi:uncharacterized protein LOC113302137 [Papaver somniferum]|uniref:uncharacterized protein LOC113302137 n=1 Tax=Papaver somniferum TaxID=3469 RepID=UPI000E6FBE9E|nr:uncharacterized protein LOC113302137 [Papaver somniferum]
MLVAQILFALTLKMVEVTAAIVKKAMKEILILDVKMLMNAKILTTAKMQHALIRQGPITVSVQQVENPKPLVKEDWDARLTNETPFHHSSCIGRYWGKHIDYLGQVIVCTLDLSRERK